MADWIALDESTQKALREALGPQGEIGMAHGSALRSALDSEQRCAILLPATQDGYAHLVTLERRPAIAQPAAKTEAEYVGMGFLGLSGSSEEEEPEPKKKSWWKKLVE